MVFMKKKASSIFFVLVLIICFISSGVVEGLDNKAKSAYHKDGMMVANTRKLLGHIKVMDYDYTGPNPKHDPRKGKPGRGP